MHILLTIHIYVMQLCIHATTLPYYDIHSILYITKLQCVYKVSLLTTNRLSYISICTCTQHLRDQSYASELLRQHLVILLSFLVVFHKRWIFNRREGQSTIIGWNIRKFLHTPRWKLNSDNWYMYKARLKYVG